MENDGLTDRKALRVSAFKAIEQHLQAHGPKEWSSLRATFSQVSDRTWWRWIASVKEAQSQRSSAAIPVGATAPLVLSEQNVLNQDEFKAQQIRRLNFTGMMMKQMKDIDLLQSSAMSEDGNIRNFAIFTQALTLRERAMASFAKSVIPLTEPLLREDFMNAVCDAMSAVDKETGVRVMQSIVDAAGLGLTAYYEGK